MSQVLQVNGDYLVKVSDGGKITLDTGTNVGEVKITGNLVVENNVKINGSLTLGNASEDDILLLGEIASNINPKVANLYDLGNDRQYWRSLYVSQIQNPLGEVTITDLVDPSDDQDAATKSYVDNAVGRVENVFYVSKSGNDLNDGRSLNKSKLTIKAAVEAAKLSESKGYDTTIFVKSGDYSEDNPIRLPEKLTIVGDNVRSVTIRPLNKQFDIFWVTNGNYISDLTFKDHEFPTAAVAFPPPTEEFPAVAIHTSPYVQNCTSMTSTGCGMRVDGRYVLGLRSMVLDAFTQYNQGGLGIHMLYRGNTQLVSAFTINCDIAILCTEGGFCSLTNSNSSFGNFGLVSDGVSLPLYSGNLLGNELGITGDTIVLNNLNQRPNVGDAISFNGSTDYYTVTLASNLSAGDVEIIGPDYSPQPALRKTIRQLVRSEKDKIATDTIDYVNDTYKDLNYNQFKCTRDTNFIIDAAVDDLVLGTNYKSIQVGLSYSRLSAAVVRNEQLAESTDALIFTRNEVLNVVGNVALPLSPEYITVQDNFNLMYDLFLNADNTSPPTPPLYIWTPPVGASQSKINARDIILDNREFLIEEAIAFIEANLSFTYDRETCRRDVELIIDAITYDMMFGSNFRSITAGRAYYRAGAAVVIAAQKTASIDAFKYLKSLLLKYTQLDTAEYISISENMELIIDILDQGLSAVPPVYTIPNPTDYNTGFENARDLIEANRAFIKAEIIEFIDQNFVGPESFVYDQSACERDIDYILDALFYDLTYGGNLETLIAGNAYFSGNTTVNPGEEAETLAAYEYLKTIIVDIAQNIDIVELQLTVTQITGVAGSLVAAETARDLIEYIRVIISQGPKPEILYPDLRWVNPSIVSIHLIIQDDKDDIAKNVTNYIDSRYFLLEYDRGTCQRDVGLIIDALYFDLIFGSNFRTITAARAYSRGTASVVTSVQLPATINAFNKMKQLVVAILSSTDDTSLVAPVSLLMDIILDVLAEGLTAIPNYILPEPIGYDIDYKNARNLIEANRSFIKAEVLEYINQTYIIPFTFVYDEEKCARDIDYILDAVYYDLTYGGNLETLIAGRAYYSFGGTVIPGEETETLGAYEFMRDLIIDIAQDIDVVELQFIELQVSGDPGNLAAANAAGQLIEDIRTIISTPDSEPAAVNPDISWVDIDVETVAQSLLLEKANVQDGVTDFIDSRYNTNVVPFTYDAEKCKRDVGLIVDAIAWDMIFGSNVRSITAGRSYSRANASLVTTRQKKATIEAYEILKDYLVDLVSENIDAVESVSNNMDIIIDIFDQGLTAVPDRVLPDPTDYGDDSSEDQLRRARDLIDVNREFIKAQVIRYISNQQLSSLGYDKEKCRRDIGLIIDALSYDLMFESNFRSITAGRAYTRANAATVTSVQKAATIDAFTYLKTELLNLFEDSALTSFSIENNMNIIINIFDNGLSSVPSYIIPAPPAYDAGFENARDLIEANRAFIKAEVIEYISINYPVVYSSFDQSACERDIDYILDALFYDLTYGGNLETVTAGVAYYVGSTLQLGVGELAATLDSYDYMKSIILDIAQNIDIAEIQIVVPQVTGDAGSLEAAITAANLVEIIIDIIDTEVVPAFVEPDVSWVQLLGDKNRLQTNKEHIGVQITDYIDNYYPFSYDRELCQRDVGLVLDAIGFDFMFGSNFRSITAGRSYYRAGAAVVTTLQKAATLDAFTYLKDLILNIVSSNSTAVTSATSNMNLIIDILDNGLVSVPLYVIPNPTGYDIDYENARNLIEDNRNFVKAEVIEYIAINYPAVYSSFDQIACEKDIDLILDAVYYDITYGGNMESIIAGKAYYSGSVLQLGAGEKAATLAAYAFMRDLIIEIAQNNDVIELQVSVAQVFGTAGSFAAAVDAGQLIEDIRTIIDDPENTPAINDASTVWVDGNLVSQHNSLQSNKELIKGQVTHYIDVEYVEPEYDRAKCERDIDYILDALFYDMTYGGNLETVIAANSYFVGAVVQIPGEVEATLDAYEYMKIIVKDIAEAVPVLEIQDKVNQTFGDPAEPAYSQVAVDLIENIRQVIDTGILITTPIEPDTSWVDSELLSLFDFLQEEKENAKIAVADYIDSRYFLLIYNREKCRRDVGYIIDALRFDVAFGSNFRSISAGRSYYRANASEVVNSQKSATIGALRKIKEFALIIAGGNAILEQRADDNIELIVDIINRGPDIATPLYEIPNPPGFVSGISNGRNLVENNRDFIKAEVIEFIRINYVVPSSFEYDQTACERDIDLILDAIYYDITYGTNAESIVAGNAYYVGTNIVNPGEEIETIAAYEFMKLLLIDIAQNIPVTPLQISITQEFGAPGNIDTANAIGNLVQNIIDIIDDVENQPVLLIPNIGALPSVNQDYFANLNTARTLIQNEVIIYVNAKYSYDQGICKRDTGFILDAIIYDVLYGGNSQTAAAAETYYSAGVFQIGERERLATVNTFKYLKTILGACLLGLPVIPLNTIQIQDLSNDPASADEVIKINELSFIVEEIVGNGFTSVVILNENIPEFDPVFPGSTVTFHQYSLISASGQTFEWVGAGVNVNTSLPYLGGIPISENKAVETNGGKVYWTGTDQYGDFNIGGELVIRRDSGTIEGRTFTKSLFAVLTPYILAVGE
jgi:hypothetical protein